MAGDESFAGHEPHGRHGQDRETEPIPRARTEPEDQDVFDVDQLSDRFDSTAVDEPLGETYVHDGPLVEDEATDFDNMYGESPTFTEEEFGRLREPAPVPNVASRRVMPLEEEPSRLIARYLFPTEKFRGEWKHHWIQIIWELAGIVGATILMGYLTGLCARNNQPSLVTAVIVIWLIAIVFITFRIADWYCDRFILTNKRVMVVKGLVTRNVGMMPLLRVTDMKYVQSPFGRLLGYGTFELESAGQEQALSKVKNLPNPNELYLRIVEEMYEPEAVEARLSRGGDEADGT